MPKPTPAMASSPSCRRDSSFGDASEYKRVGHSRNVLGDLQAGSVKAKAALEKRERVVAVAIDSSCSFMSGESLDLVVSLRAKKFESF
jgi:hypothetical protein